MRHRAVSLALAGLVLALPAIGAPAYGDAAAAFSDAAPTFSTAAFASAAPVVHAAPVVVQTANAPQLPEPPDDVKAWFSDKASSTVRSYGGQAFPAYSADEVANFKIGTPRATSQFASQAEVGQEVQNSNRWIAPIYDGEEAVGAISVEYENGLATNELVRADTRLGSESEQRDAQLVRDPALSAWFAIRDAMVEPADAAGANIVLGSVPLEDFLKQRQRAIEGEVKPTPEPATVGAPEEKASSNVAIKVIFALVVIAVVAGSLVWLRWEQTEKEDQPPTPPAKTPNDELAAVPRKGAVGRSVQRPRFRDSARKVAVYKTPKSKDSSAVSDD